MNLRTYLEIPLSLKMRQFQDLGHTGVVIIGDYTASIGDPTGKNESRPALDEKTIKKNSEKYMEQMYTVLDESKTEIRYQSEWFYDTTLKDLLIWASQTTVAKLLSHETFHERLEGGHSLSLHELFYPVLQGIDSVFINADVELGGTDQRFNVLMGRDYQRIRHMRPQIAMLLPIVTGTCGAQKMSKSLGNSIGVLDDPFEKFGKVMSIPDKLMLEYYEFLTRVGPGEFEQIKAEVEASHPNDAKKKLAQKIVAEFHGEETAKKMREQFENVFKNKKKPDEVPEYTFSEGEPLVDALVNSSLLKSKKEARRMIDQKAVSIVDGEKIEDAQMTLSKKIKGSVIKVGKRKFLKIL